MRAFLVATSLAFVCSSAEAQPKVSEPEVQNALDRLLLCYGSWKDLPQVVPRHIDVTLSTDRRSVFHAIVRSLFVEFRDSDNKRAGTRPIEFVDAVLGIWGVRYGDSEGRNQFRLSVLLDQGIVRELDAASNFQTVGGHVLLPDSDEDPNFSEHVFLEDGVSSFKQTGAVPPVQIGIVRDRNRLPGELQTKLELSFPAFARGDALLGEIDLDFDWPFPSRCIFQHNDPSNSDSGSVSKGFGLCRHSHLELLNNQLQNFIDRKLELNYQEERNHGKRSYTDAYYR
jgi:hypothetical protein